MRTAHQLALANPHIKAECIEATEFGELSQQYNVFGVPKSVINETVQFEGAVPEAVFVRNLMQAVQ